MSPPEDLAATLQILISIFMVYGIFFALMTLRAPTIQTQH